MPPKLSDAPPFFKIKKYISIHSFVILVYNSTFVWFHFHFSILCFIVWEILAFQLVFLLLLIFSNFFIGVNFSFYFSFAFIFLKIRLKILGFWFSRLFLNGHFGIFLWKKITKKVILFFKIRLLGLHLLVLLLVLLVRKLVFFVRFFKLSKHIDVFYFFFFLFFFCHF